MKGRVGSGAGFPGAARLSSRGASLWRVCPGLHRHRGCGIQAEAGSRDGGGRPLLGTNGLHVSVLTVPRSPHSAHVLGDLLVAFPVTPAQTDLGPGGCGPVSLAPTVGLQAGQVTPRRVTPALFSEAQCPAKGPRSAPVAPSSPWLLPTGEHKVTCSMYRDLSPRASGRGHSAAGTPGRGRRDPPGHLGKAGHKHGAPHSSRAWRRRSHGRRSDPVHTAGCPPGQFPSLLPL